MATQEAQFDGTVWFFAAADSAKASEVERDPRVNLTCASSSTWVSISGAARMVHDRQKVRDLWNPVVGAWLPSGPEDPQALCVRIG